MILEDFLLLLADTSRSKAYLQQMVKNDLLPVHCVVFVEDKENFLAQENGADFPANNKYFNINETLPNALAKAGLNYEILETKDINSDVMLAALQEYKEKYVIYSGYGGYILQKHLFALGKKFIHIHAGLLPEYRGSTTAYYSIINGGFMGASAIFLEEKIDTGTVLLAKKFPLPADGTNIDYIYEPYIRAEVLVELMKNYLADGKFSLTLQENTNAETYYIIHPVLKHIALLKVTKHRKEE